MIYLTNLIKWRTLRSQINVIINLQQHAEMEFETLHVYNSFCGATVNEAAVWCTYLTYTHVNN